MYCKKPHKFQGVDEQALLGRKRSRLLWRGWRVRLLQEGEGGDGQDQQGKERVATPRVKKPVKLSVFKPERWLGQW